MPYSNVARPSGAQSTERRHLIADLAVPILDRPISTPLRRVTPADAEALAALMLDAYEGTIDADGGETIVDARNEVNGWLADVSVPPMLEHCYVALDEDEAMLVSAVLVSRVAELPVIADAYTAAAHKGRGLSMGLMAHAMRSLRDAAERHVHLWVTVGNVPAEHIYEQLGFRDMT